MWRFITAALGGEHSYARIWMRCPGLQLASSLGLAMGPSVQPALPALPVPQRQTSSLPSLVILIFCLCTSRWHADTHGLSISQSRALSTDSRRAGLGLRVCEFSTSTRLPAACPHPPRSLNAISARSILISPPRRAHHAGLLFLLLRPVSLLELIMVLFFHLLSFLYP